MKLAPFFFISGLLLLACAQSSPQRPVPGTLKPLPLPATSPDLVGGATRARQGLAASAPLDAELEGSSAEAFWLSEKEGGLRTYVVEFPAHREGELPPLVMVHGLGEAGVRDFYRIAEPLAQKRRVILIDLPGLGRSEIGELRPSPLLFAQRVQDVLAARVTDRFDLVGHSLGGAVALIVAARETARLRKLALIDAAGMLHRDAFVESQLQGAIHPLEDYHQGAAGTLSQAGRGLLSMSRLATPSDSSLRLGAETLTGMQAQAALALIQFNMAPFFPKVRAETFLLWGMEDSVAPLRSAEFLRDRLEGERVFVLQGIGHVPPIEAPEATIVQLNRFFASSSLVKSPEKTALQNGAESTCDGEEDRIFTGRHARISITDCDGVVLRHVEAQYLDIASSSVIISRSRVLKGTYAKDSELVITGGELGGDIALLLDESQIDIAGSVLRGHSAAVQALSSSEVLFSSTSLHTDSRSGALHRRVEFGEGEGF